MVFPGKHVWVFLDVSPLDANKLKPRCRDDAGQALTVHTRDENERAVAFLPFNIFSFIFYSIL